MSTTSKGSKDVSERDLQRMKVLFLYFFSPMRKEIHKIFRRKMLGGSPALIIFISIYQSEVKKVNAAC